MFYYFIHSKRRARQIPFTLFLDSCRQLSSRVRMEHTDPAWKLSTNLYDIYVVGSKSFRPDIQKLRQMENAARDI